jgi:hypothetical protein
MKTFDIVGGFESWKRSTTEKHRQDRSCLFRPEDYRNKSHNPTKFLRLSPAEGSFCSSETMHDTRMKQRTNMFVSARGLQELMLETGKF